MAIHTIPIAAHDEFYSFYMGHRCAMLVEYDENKYKQWDTIMLTCDVPRWRDMPIYRKLSFFEYAGKNQMLLHLKQ